MVVILFPQQASIDYPYVKTFIFLTICNFISGFYCTSIHPYLHPLAAQNPGRPPHEHRGGRADLLKPLDGGAAQVEAHRRLGDAHGQRVVVTSDLKDGNCADDILFVPFQDCW